MTHSDLTSSQPLADTPRIYVACLASYNNGKLHGAWIDATQSAEDIQFEIDMMLKASSEPDSEEVAIHDFENFQGFSLNEFENLERVSEVANFIVEHGRQDQPAFQCIHWNADKLIALKKLRAKVLQYFGGDLEDAREAFERYIGCYKSLADWAEEFTEETTQIPENLESYIDYEALARDIDMSGDVITFEMGFEEVYIFWAR